jgi:uncharacterized membrane protein YvbJ
MKLCPKCGSKNETRLGQTACLRCGAELPPQSVEEELAESFSDRELIDKKRKKEPLTLGAFLVRMIIVGIILWILTALWLLFSGKMRDHAL